MTKSVSIISLLIIGMTSLFSQTRHELLIEFSEVDSIKELLIEFSEIDSLQYMSFKKDYSRELEFDSSKISMYDSSFTLTINNKKQRFEGDTQAEERYIYEGFLPSLNSFVLTKCRSWYCGTILIDRATGNRQPIMTPYEAPCNTQILMSKDKNKILVFTSDAFATESYISIYQRGDGIDHFDFNHLKILTCDKWKVDEAVWIDDKTFALLTYDDVACRMKSSPVAYVKGEIK